MARRSRAQMLDQTRRLLVVAGRESFGARGYADTSMDQLTASAGLTRGALYHHFGGKSGLFAAVVTAVDAEIDAQLEDVAEQAPDPVSALSERAETYIELTQSPEVQQILLHDAPSVLPDAAATYAATCIDSITRLIEQGRESGLISPHAPARALAVLINGALVDSSRWVAVADVDKRADRLAEAREAARLLVAGLRSAPQG